MRRYRNPVWLSSSLLLPRRHLLLPPLRLFSNRARHDVRAERLIRGVPLDRQVLNVGVQALHRVATVLLLPPLRHLTAPVARIFQIKGVEASRLHVWSLTCIDVLVLRDFDLTMGPVYDYFGQIFATNLTIFVGAFDRGLPDVDEDVEVVVD